MHFIIMLRATCLLSLIALSYARSTYYAELGGRVVNGTDAPPGKYPFLVSYRALNSHSCGGTILNENWVLTAGHCVNGDNVNRISILSGTVDLEVGGTRHDAAELILHPDYSGATTRNDIALVRVVQPFVWDSMTAPVALPVQGQITDGGMNATLTGWGLPYGDSGGPLLVNGEQVGIVSWSEKPCTIAPYPGVFTEVETPFVWNNVTAPAILPKQSQETPGGSPATLTGWGLPYTGGSVMQMLQEVDYWIIGDKECQNAHTSYTVFETNICAYYPGGGKGQCSGDSGGPLFVDGVQVGVVSWSEKPCTITPYPGVFTEVSAYIDWIHTHTNEK
ncbi:UNVERIFIED_CONTAM: hypothetical protein B566_EDAN018537 [Ephemera danica]|nr:hypothetical protein B566_EDAN018537 [Ephemera danica]